ncbi:MAG: hypothetical protein ACHP9Z_12690 [Streptosporangiales bacterium]
MTPAELDVTGLDPAHILAICADFDVDGGARATRTAEGVRVSMPSRRTAWEASGALGRAGYTASLGGNGHSRRDVLVTGWNALRLDHRLVSLRATMHRLADNPLVTATAVVRRVAALPVSAVTPDALDNILWESRLQVRRWVNARAGICAPFPPMALPADPALAVRVRAATACEQVIDDLIDRHMRVAGHAVGLFGSLRQRMEDGRAQYAAVRRAGITFHLSGGSVAQDSTSLMRAAAGGGRHARQSAVPQPELRRAAAQEFPAPPGATGIAGPAPPAGRGGPGGQAFPAARPGHHP